MNDPHMSPQEFREHGYRTIDWIADYWESLESRPVAAPVEPGSVRERLPQDPPESGEPFDRFLRDMEDVVAPALLHWQHPRFFGYFPANASGPAVLGDLLASGLGVQGMNWNTSPACTEVEQHMLEWMRRTLGLPERFRDGGVIQDTASSAVLVAVLAALQRATGGRSREVGTGGQRYAVYLTSETHSAATKAAVIAGLGLGSVRTVATGADGAMLPEELRARIEADLGNGVTPLMAVATRGTTSALAFDPLEEVGAVCRNHDVWLHVDAAYAGVAGVCEDLRWVNAGVEYADSYCTNPHKWLLTNFDCDLFWVADHDALTGALSVLPEYLRNTASDSGRVTDFRHWQIPLGRRFRALKLWSVLRWYGVEGLRGHVRVGVEHARMFADLVRADDRFELTRDPCLGLVCFRLTADGATNEAQHRLMETVNTEGTTFLTHSERDGQVFLRFATGGTFTRDHHVVEAWKALQGAVTEG